MPTTETMRLLVGHKHSCSGAQVVVYSSIGALHVLPRQASPPSPPLPPSGTPSTLLQQSCPAVLLMCAVLLWCCSRRLLLRVRTIGPTYSSSTLTSQPSTPSV